MISSKRGTSAAASCFRELEVRLTLALPPAALRDLHGAVCARLNHDLMKYVGVEGGMGGVLVAYWGLQLEEQVARILYEQPELHCRVRFQALFFSPSPGITLVGEVNKVGSDHVGLLVGGAFNASVSRSQVPADFEPVITTSPPPATTKHDDEEDGEGEEEEEKEEKVAVAQPDAPKAAGEAQESGSSEGGFSAECWRSTTDPTRELRTGGLAALQVKAVNTARGMITIFGSMLAPNTGPLSSDARRTVTLVADVLVNGSSSLKEEDSDNERTDDLVTTRTAAHPEDETEQTNQVKKEAPPKPHKRGSKEEDHKTKPARPSKRKNNEPAEDLGGTEGRPSKQKSDEKGSKERKKHKSSKKRRLDTTA